MTNKYDPSEAAIAADWQVLDPPVSLVRLKSGRVLPVLWRGTVDTVSLRGNSNIANNHRPEEMSSLKSGIVCEISRAQATDDSERAEETNVKTEGNIGSQHEDKETVNSMSDINKNNNNDKDEFNEDETKMDEMRKPKASEENDGTIRPDGSFTTDIPRGASASSKASGVVSNAATYVSTHARDGSSHDFADEFQVHAKHSRRKRSHIRHEAVKLIDKHDSKASMTLKKNTVSPTSQSPVPTEPENIDPNANFINDTVIDEKQEIILESRIPEQNEKQDTKDTTGHAKRDSVNVKPKQVNSTKGRSTKPPSKPPRVKTVAPKVADKRDRTPPSSDSKEEDVLNASTVSSKSEFKTENEALATEEKHQSKPSDCGEKEEAGEANKDDGNPGNDDQETTDDSDVTDAQTHTPSRAEDFRLHLDNTQAVYPGIMSERFYREFRRERLRTLPPGPPESDTVVQQKALLDLMSKGLGNFTTQMAEILIARIKPEYETLARQVAEEVKESANQELHRLREGVAKGETTITALRKENAGFIENHEKERNALKKALESEKQKRNKDFEESTQKIEKLMLDLEKANMALKDKDKIVQKAKMKAKHEEQKRIKLEEEHAVKTDELKKEVEKAKCEVSVIKAKKRIQSASTKQKGQGAPGMIVSHHGMYPRQWGQLKEIPYDEGDD